MLGDSLFQELVPCQKERKKNEKHFAMSNKHSGYKTFPLLYMQVVNRAGSLRTQT